MTEFKLQPEAKAKWVAALRSGKFEQGRGALQKDLSSVSMYCCLGVAVACELTSPQGLFMNFWVEDEFIPEDIQVHLARMNDKGKSFPEIADWIEANL